jgi:non-specific serine/threonine protein kinase
MQPNLANPSKSYQLKHFYIPDEQSIYLLSHKDAQRLKEWFSLCIQQLKCLGYSQIELIGKGAFGFVFAGLDEQGTQLVFKFSRINLPQQVQDRLEEEAFMLSHVKHAYVPALVEFQHIKKQAILVMHRAKGKDLEQVSLEYGPLPARLIVKITVQLIAILTHLRSFTANGQAKPIVHGDIKPSNLMWDEVTEQLSLVDWGSCVFAQRDTDGQPIAANIMDLMSSDLQLTNARLGDIYFIGNQQLKGALSTPRFDEQGLASTLYALASGQSCRYGKQVITPESLGLPQELARVLNALMSDDIQQQAQAGDYLFRNVEHLSRIVFAKDPSPSVVPLIPTWIKQSKRDIDTVVYSSRKSFLRAEQQQVDELQGMNDAQFERYYKHYLQGMGETEKAFVAAVGRLGKYPVVGGLAINWQQQGVYIDSSLNLYDPDKQVAFDASVNNLVHLARAIKRVGVFKSCMFNAKNTLHLTREHAQSAFIPEPNLYIAYELSQHHLEEDSSRTHSYFEDGRDPDEFLELPRAMIDLLKQLNAIHHTGCIIFEALATHLKLHSYFVLLDHQQQSRFKQLLAQILDQVRYIQGEGLSGFMKLPFKDTRFFSHQERLPDTFYPRNPKL